MTSHDRLSARTPDDSALLESLDLCGLTGAPHLVIGLLERLAVTSGRVPLPEAFARVQALLRVVYGQLADTSGPLTETFYDTLRASLVAAGATDADLEAVAYVLVAIFVDIAPFAVDERTDQCELIARHLVGTDMTVRRMAGRGTHVRVEFPARVRQ